MSEIDDIKKRAEAIVISYGNLYPDVHRVACYDVPKLLALIDEALPLIDYLWSIETDLQASSRAHAWLRRVAK